MNILILLYIDEQNNNGLVYDFDATDGDRGDVSNLIYSFVVNESIHTKFQTNF